MVAKWSSFFVRSSNYLLTNLQRAATSRHGALCTLINPVNLITTLAASWSYKLIIQGAQLLFQHSWFKQYAQICRAHKFRALDHMINSTTVDWDKVSVEKNKCNTHIFVHHSLISMCKMGFRRPPILVFEDLMNQHVFGNIHIQNPDTSLPWEKSKSPFAKIMIID